MKKQRRRARVVVRTGDPALRSLIIERLSAGGDMDVEWEGSDGNGGGVPEAFVDERPEDAPLTPRETEVLALMAEGLANKEIAARLGISFSTAKFHADSIFRKLSAANRAEAVRQGIRMGAIGI